MKKSRTLQLRAMNKALSIHAEGMIRSAELLQSDANIIRQNVRYNEPYNNMEVYKTNSIYETLIKTAEKNKTEIKSLKEKEE